MKKIRVAILVSFFCLLLSAGFTQEIKPVKAKVILLIAEQNIGAPQRGWWVSEIDLSATEAVLAQKLIEHGYEVLEPSLLTGIIKQRPAFRALDLSRNQSVKLGNLANADYVISGKAVASAGGKVPRSNMRSCFANLSAKIIRVKDAKVIAYLNASGNSAHPDVITGGKEALINAAGDLSVKLLEALK
jgi:hypothetical protein